MYVVGFGEEKVWLLEWCRMKPDRFGMGEKLKSSQVGAKRPDQTLLKNVWC